jgi:hypothetical protein
MGGGGDAMTGPSVEDDTVIPGPMEFAAMGAQQFEKLAAIQAELSAKLQQANVRWFEAIQKRAKLASDFAVKLQTARSVPETLSACQDWVRQRTEMAEEDAKHFVVDTQTLMEAGVRLMANGWLLTGKTES